MAKLCGILSDVNLGPVTNAEPASVDPDGEIGGRAATSDRRSFVDELIRGSVPMRSFIENGKYPAHESPGGKGVFVYYQILSFVRHFTTPPVSPPTTTPPVTPTHYDSTCNPHPLRLRL